MQKKNFWMCRKQTTTFSDTEKSHIHLQFKTVRNVWVAGKLRRVLEMGRKKTLEIRSWVEWVNKPSPYKKCLCVCVTVSQESAGKCAFKSGERERERERERFQFQFGWAKRRERFFKFEFELVRLAKLNNKTIGSGPGSIFSWIRISFLPGPINLASLMCHVGMEHISSLDSYPVH